jgi:hemoglobin
VPDVFVQVSRPLAGEIRLRRRSPTRERRQDEHPEAERGDALDDDQDTLLSRLLRPGISVQEPEMGHYTLAAGPTAKIFVGGYNLAPSTLSHSHSGAHMTNPDAKSLYARLGGYDALAAAVDDLMPRLHADPQIGSYWKGQNTQTKKRGRQMVLDFLVQALGGPAAYHGLDMKAAHEGLSITERDWAVMEGHFVAVLDKFGIQGREREELLGAAGSLKADIVQG